MSDCSVKMSLSEILTLLVNQYDSEMTKVCETILEVVNQKDQSKSLNEVREEYLPLAIDRFYQSNTMVLFKRKIMLEMYLHLGEGIGEFSIDFFRPIGGNVKEIKIEFTYKSDDKLIIEFANDTVTTNFLAKSGVELTDQYESLKDHLDQILELISSLEKSFL